MSFFLILLAVIYLLFFPRATPSLPILSHSLPLWLHPSSLSLTSSQASLALIDPLVRACGTAMNCTVTSSPRREGARVEIRGQPQKTDHYKDIMEKVRCLSACVEIFHIEQSACVKLSSVLHGLADMLYGALDGNI